MGRTAFISVAAAEMNLGDVFIRRAITRHIAANDHHAVVYTGSMGESYVGAFELPDTWVVTGSPRRFLPLLLRACLRREALVIMAPAPARLDRKGFYLAKQVGVACLLALTRLCGNRVVVMGRALRGSGRLAVMAERMTARISSLYLARDPQTAELMGSNAQFKPDLGFADIAARPRPDVTSNSPRTLVALSLRYDRPPVTELVVKFVERVRAQGFEVVMVTQVRQDRAINQKLADACGIDHVDWPHTRSHLDQESAVIDVYSRCIAVVSNRLHALVIGGRYGAVPIIADEINESKLHATLDDLLKPQSVWLHSSADEQPIDVSETEVERMRAQFAAAAEALEPALQELQNLLGSPTREALPAR